MLIDIKRIEVFEVDQKIYDQNNRIKLLAGILGKENIVSSVEIEKKLKKIALESQNS